MGNVSRLLETLLKHFGAEFMALDGLVVLCKLAVFRCSFGRLRAEASHVVTPNSVKGDKSLPPMFSLLPASSADAESGSCGVKPLKWAMSHWEWIFYDSNKYGLEGSMITPFVALASKSPAKVMEQLTACANEVLFSILYSPDFTDGSFRFLAIYDDASDSPSLSPPSSAASVGAGRAHRGDALLSELCLLATVDWFTYLFGRLARRLVDPFASAVFEQFVSGLTLLDRYVLWKQQCSLVAQTAVAQHQLDASSMQALLGAQMPAATATAASSAASVVLSSSAASSKASASESTPALEHKQPPAAGAPAVTFSALQPDLMMKMLRAQTVAACFKSGMPEEPEELNSSGAEAENGSARSYRSAAGGVVHSVLFVTCQNAFTHFATMSTRLLKLLAKLSRIEPRRSASIPAPNVQLTLIVARYVKHLLDFRPPRVLSWSALFLYLKYALLRVRPLVRASSASSSDRSSLHRPLVAKLHEFGCSARLVEFLRFFMAIYEFAPRVRHAPPLSPSLSLGAEAADRWSRANDAAGCAGAPSSKMEAEVGLAPPPRSAAKPSWVRAEPLVPSELMTHPWYRSDEQSVPSLDLNELWPTHALSNLGPYFYGAAVELGSFLEILCGREACENEQFFTAAVLRESWSHCGAFSNLDGSLLDQLLIITRRFLIDRYKRDQSSDAALAVPQSQSLSLTMESTSTAPPAPGK